MHTSEPYTLIPRRWEEDHGDVNKLVAVEQTRDGDDSEIKFNGVGK